MSIQRIRIQRLLVLLLTMLMLFAMAVPAYAAGGVNTAEYWNEMANQIVNSGTLKNSSDLAKRLSGVAGDSQFVLNGEKFYTIVVTSGLTQYVGGREVDPNSPVDVSRYQAISVASVPSHGGPTRDVTVYVHNDADSAALGKISAHATQGLLNQANVNPDTGTAMGLLSGIMPAINVVLGLMVVVISIGMTVFSALDIIYLAFPAFKLMVDNSIEQGDKGTRTTKDGTVTSRWVTQDAIMAAQDAEKTHGSPWGPYFKRRILAYVFLAAILFILLTGNIFSITTLVTNALQGLFNSLGL
jgi:hypothetical protein